MYIVTGEHFFHCFFERQRKGERGKHRYERETLIGYLPNVPRPRMVRVWTRDQIHNLGVCPD